MAPQVHELSSGRTGAPRSPQRTPDFLSNFLALSNSMRLSLMKAAHADVGGASCRKSGYVGRKRVLRMLLPDRPPKRPCDGTVS
jgi:hypothetical protein